jgi:hypothetical protein
MVVAFVALVAALSGTAVALPGSNSVNSGDIKNNTITSSDIKNNSIKSTDVKNGSLLSKDFKSGQLPAGPAGPAGAAGAPGAAGSALALAHVKLDGTLDAAASKAVILRNHPNTGLTCLTVPPGSISVTGTADYGNTSTDPIVVEASLTGSDITGFGCDAGSNALIFTYDSGSLSDQGFFAVIN